LLVARLIAVRSMLLQPCDEQKLLTLTNRDHQPQCCIPERYPISSVLCSGSVRCKLRYMGSEQCTVVSTGHAAATTTAAILIGAGTRADHLAILTVITVLLLIRY
jgi:hypothetical protein